MFPLIHAKAILRHFIFIFSYLGFFISNSLAQAPVSEHGQLKVQGSFIMDQRGIPVQLAGMSLFWSQWKGKYYNYNVVKWLKEDWKCDVVRAAMGVGKDGYAKNKVREQKKMEKVIEAALDLGIYVIVDFHEHHAEQYLREAQAFFSEIAKKYGHHSNIIYEIYNEPLDVSWSEVIKPYSEAVIDTIRKYDPDNIIICGTRNWSQQVSEAASDPIREVNIAYSLHFYAGSHQQWLRDMAEEAMDNGVALFVTEYGTTEANGDGKVYIDETHEWWAFMDQRKISHCNWSVTDKTEASAVLYPKASVNGNWPIDKITPSGRFVRSMLRERHFAAEKEE